MAKQPYFMKKEDAFKRGVMLWGRNPEEEEIKDLFEQGGQDITTVIQNTSMKLYKFNSMSGKGVGLGISKEFGAYLLWLVYDLETMYMQRVNAS